ncbi:MAG: phosphoglycerate dehydrogenase, partial [Thermoplasmata archaeon]
MPDPPLVVVADPIDRSAIAHLRGGPCTVVDASAEPSGLPEALGSAWGLIVRSRTKVDRKLLAAAPELKLVARAGVG